jgi:hypothetical protein
LAERETAGTNTGFQGVIVVRRILLNTAIALIVASPISHAEGFMTKEQRQATFCGKTFDGENLISGVTFKIHIDSACRTNTIHFLTGKKAGKTEERKIISMSDEGESCHTSNRDYCNKMKDMGDGTYIGLGTSGKWKDKEYVKLSNIVDGNQL